MIQSDDYLTKDLGVRVTRAYLNMRVGNVIYPPGLLRDKLVKAGFAERILPPAEPEKETKRGAQTKAL